MSYPQEISSKRKFSVGDPRTSTESYCDPGDVYNRANKAENERWLGKETGAKDNGESLRNFIEVEKKDWCSVEGKSINAIGGNSWNELLKVEARVLGRKATVLIDGGAQDNFVSKGFVKHLRAKTRRLKDVSKAILADGSTYVVNEHLPGTRLNVSGGYNDRVDLKVVSMQYDVILGKPWLAKYNPCINWRKNEIIFNKDGKKIVWNAVLHKDMSKNMISSLSLKRLSRKSELFLVWIKSSDEKYVDKSELRDAILSEYSDVFAEKLPKGLPPARNVDHKIELENGTIPPNRPVYRMSLLSWKNYRAN